MGYIVLAFGFSFETGGRNAFIDELYVAPEHRGKGIARRALEFIERAGQEAGVKALHLEVSRDNYKALGLYDRASYVNHDRYLMTKQLNRSALGDSD